MEQFELPIAPITRLLKQALPPNINVSKEVKQSLGKAAALFVLYLTHTANEVCKQHRRQTVSPEDVLAAVEEIEFEQFLEPLKAYLVDYKDEQVKKKVAKPKADGAAAEGGAKKRGRAKAADGEHGGKKAKVDAAAAAASTAAPAAAGEAAAMEEEAASAAHSDHDEDGEEE